MCLRPLACWDWDFESRRGHGCMSVVSAVCCQLEVFGRADRLSRGALPSAVCLNVIVKLRHWVDPGPLRAVAPLGGGKDLILFVVLISRIFSRNIIHILSVFSKTRTEQKSFMISVFIKLDNLHFKYGNFKCGDWLIHRNMTSYTVTFLLWFVSGMIDIKVSEVYKGGKVTFGMWFYSRWRKEGK